MYKLDKFGGIIRTMDGASIPCDPANMDYASYLRWEEAGNTPLPYVQPPVDIRPVAQAALDKSDTTILRCYEAGVAVPVEWATYRGQLREIVSGKSSETELPMRPPYPADS